MLHDDDTLPSPPRTTYTALSGRFDGDARGVPHGGDLRRLQRVFLGPLRVDETLADAAPHLRLGNFRRVQRAFVRT